MKIDLTPKIKRLLVWTIAGTVIVCLALLASPSDKERRNDDERTVKHVLTDFNTRELGVDSLASGIKLLHTREDALRREIASLRKELELLKKSAGIFAEGKDPALESRLKTADDLISELKLIRSLLPKTLRQGSGIEDKKKVISKDLNNTNSNANIKPTTPPLEFKEESVVAKDWYKLKLPNQPYDNMKPTSNLAGQLSNKSLGNDLLAKDSNNGILEFDPNATTLGPHIKKITPPQNKTNSKISAVKQNELSQENKNPGIYIPLGSIISGYLITGLDAPTADIAKTEPFPVLIAVDKSTLMPNHFRADLVDCTILAAAYGDMSSERVYMRAESMSCITDMGLSIEVELSGYATGSDGKAGLRGRLVSRQGRLIARSLTAGFLQGLAGAFDVNPVPTINTTGTGQVEYDSVYNSKALAGAGAKGTSKALERIADFYMRLADNMFPVLELDASRRVDIVLTKGVNTPQLLHPTSVLYTQNEDL